MPSPRRDPGRSIAAIGLALGLAGAAAGQDLSALRARLPDQALLLVEIAQPAVAVQQLAAAIGRVPDDLPDLVRTKLALGLSALRLALGDEPEAGAGQLAGGGAVAALGSVHGRWHAWLVARPGDPTAAMAFCRRVAGRVVAEVHDGLLLVASDDVALAGLRSPVPGHGGRWAQAELGDPAALRGVIDLVALRALAGTAAPTLVALDGGGRWLLGPLVHAVEHGSRLQFAVDGGERLQLRVRVDASVRTAAFGALLPERGERASLLLPHGGLAAVQLDRRLAALLRTPERWLAPSDALAVQGFLSIVDALDGVRSSFVDDLMEGIGEPFVLHVLPAPTWAENGPPPPLRLPGFVVAAPIAPAAADIAWRLAQAFALVANAERVQRGQAAFTLRATRHDDGRGLVAELPPWTGPGAPPLDRALTPTLYLRHGHLLVASTTAAADAVVAAIGAAAPTPAGDRLELRGPELAAWLAQHREIVELGRMLDEGHDRAEVQRHFDTVDAVARAVARMLLVVEADAAATTATLSLERAR